MWYIIFFRLKDGWGKDGWMDGWMEHPFLSLLISVVSGQW